MRREGSMGTFDCMMLVRAEGIGFVEGCCWTVGLLAQLEAIMRQEQWVLLENVTEESYCCGTKSDMQRWRPPGSWKKCGSKPHYRLFHFLCFTNPLASY